MSNETFRDIPARVLQSRWTLFLILLGIQALFFVTNGINSLLREPDDGWELKIAAIDNHLTPQGLWLVPYAVGFFFSAMVPLWAAHTMPIRLYRQFILSMALAALFSYTIYMLFPTYVVKPKPDDVPGSSIFSELLRTAYEVDNTASTHNAAPSQHVFYAVINMCFVIRFRPRTRVMVAWVMLASLITASALLTRQHHSPDLIAGYIVAIGAYWAGLRLGARVTDRLADEDSPQVAPLRVWTRRRQSRDMQTDVT